MTPYRIIPTIVLASIVLAGCGGGSSSTSQSSATVGTAFPEREEASEPAPAATEPGVGHSLIYRSAQENIGPHEVDDNGTMRLRLLSIDTNAEPPPYMDPDMPSIKHGYKFVKVHLELKNEGHRPELESGLEYALLNAQGDRYAPFSDEYEPRLGNAGESWNTDTLQPGDIITGYIGFNVPPSFRAAHLRVTATASEEAEPGSWKL